MDTQRTGSYEPGQIDAPFVGNDRFVTETPVARSFVGHGPAAAVGENVLPARNRVQWGPIMAGLLTTLAAMLVLTVLGLAIGASAFENENISTEAAIWGAASAIVAFFLGGWVAAKTAAVGGGFSGLMQGFIVGATALALILWLTGTGLGNLFGTIGSNVGDIANVVQDTGVTTDDATQAQDEATGAVDTATGTVSNAFANAEDEAWGTLGGLVLALGAATLGGYLGHNKRRDLIQGTG
jgi:hypothetical protein